MSGVLSRNLSDISKITIFMEECRNMQLDVLGPDVNESYRKFTVNKSGAIRFGMAGIKGVGEGAVDAIIAEREKNGPFKDIYDFVERLNLTTVNKKNMEALANAGAFDNFGTMHRAQFFAGNNATDETSFIEYLIRYGNRYQSDKSSNQNTLFGSIAGGGIEIKKPEIPQCEQFTTLEKLKREKDLIGIYLSAHPLDDFRLEMKYFINTPLKTFDDINLMAGRDFSCGGIVTNCRKGTSKTGNPYAIMMLEDYNGSYEFAFFGKDYIDYAAFIEKGRFIMIKGKIQPKRGSQTEFEPKVHHIELLQELREKLVTSVTLKIPLQALTNELIAELSDLTMNEQNGKVLLRFSIIDKENRSSVNLLSRTTRINLTNDMIRFFEDHDGIEFAIN